MKRIRKTNKTNKEMKTQLKLSLLAIKNTAKRIAKKLS